MAVYETLDSSQLFSRKISVTEKFLIFHTVPTFPTFLCVLRYFRENESLCHDSTK